MLECNVFGLKETKKNGSLSCEVVDLRKIRAISGVSRAKITRKSIVHCYRPLRPEAFLEKVQVWCGLRCNTDRPHHPIVHRLAWHHWRPSSLWPFHRWDVLNDSTFLCRINSLSRSCASQKHTQASGSSLTHLCSPKSRSLANALFVHHVIYLRLLKRKYFLVVPYVFIVEDQSPRHTVKLDQFA